MIDYTFDYESISKPLYSFNRLKKTIQSYVIDFLDLDDYLKLLNLSKIFRKEITQRKVFITFISIMKDKIANTKYYVDRLLYDNHKIEFFTENNSLTVRDQSMIINNFYKRIFNHKLTIHISDINTTGLVNLQEILNHHHSNINILKLILDDCDDLMTNLKKFANTQNEKKKIKVIKIDWIHHKPMKYLKEYLKTFKNPFTLELRRKYEKRPFDFCDLLTGLNVKELRLKGFNEKEIYMLCSYLSTQPTSLTSICLRDSPELINSSLFSALENNSTLRRIDITNKKINLKLLESLVRLLALNKNLEEVILSKHLCKEKIDSISRIKFR